MDENQLKRLINGYFNNRLTTAEWESLYRVLKETKYDQALKQAIEDVLNNEKYGQKMPETSKERLFEGIMIKAAKREKQIHKKSLLYSVSAAAAILLILIGCWIIFKNRADSSSGSIAVTSHPQVQKKNNNIQLILSNGQTLILDSANNGVIAQQGNTSIIQQDSKISYHKQVQKQGNKIAYNTIKIPRGKQFMVVLPDGSKVWLNAASTLHFPTMFEGKNREVSLTGEGYFEIAKNESKPFIVHVQTKGYKEDVEVLGTRFNIKAYENDKNIRTTLLEGKVRVTGEESSLFLNPGEAAQLKNDGRLHLIKGASIQEAIAWKNGLFYFNNTDIKMVMRQIERWYDKKVEYKGRVNARISGLISRNTDLPKVLQMLELTREAHFNIEGNKIVISTK